MFNCFAINLNSSSAKPVALSSERLYPVSFGGDLGLSFSKRYDKLEVNSSS